MSKHRTYKPGDLVFIRQSRTPLRDLNYFDSDSDPARISNIRLHLYTNAIVLNTRSRPVGYNGYRILLVLTAVGIGWVFDSEVI